MATSESSDALMTHLPATSIDEPANADMAAFAHRMDRRFEDLEQAVLARIDEMEQRVIAVIRGELVQAVSGQTRMMIFTMAVAVVSVGGFAVALALLA